jgi:hypothetical protein
MVRAGARPDYPASGPGHGHEPGAVITVSIEAASHCWQIMAGSPEPVGERGAEP